MQGLITNLKRELMIDIKTIPLVCIDKMNEIHFEEIDILNNLLKLIDNSDDANEITAHIQLLVNHMQEHFSYEENMMKDKSYPMYSIHQADHNKVLNATRYAMMDWRSSKDEDSLREYFKEELIEWLDQHIKAMDTPAAEFLVS